MHDILQKIQVNMPFRMLVDRYLPMVLEERINLEIGFDCFALDGFGKEDFLKVAGILRDEGLTITFHAPFYDLRPGAVDRRIREVTIERLNQVFELVPYFKPKSIVCHPSFDSRYYVSNDDLWLENSRDTWMRFLAMADRMDTVIVLENVYENNPEILNRLINSLNKFDNIRFCFDTGHFNAFSSAPLKEWLESLGTCIGEIHLHDNDGLTDEHAPVGEGSFPFQRFFEFLSEKNIRPIITVEPHTEENLWHTLRNIKDMKLLEYLD